MANKKLPEMKSVTSSQIKSVGYDKTTSTLYIQFNRGGIFSYNPVTEEAHKDMMNAESVGKYFHANIRNNERITFTKLND